MEVEVVLFKEEGEKKRKRNIYTRANVPKFSPHWKEV